MTDDEKWVLLQKQAAERAKAELLAALLAATGLDKYIEERIEAHYGQAH